jgi:hypothetical protein
MSVHQIFREVTARAAFADILIDALSKCLQHMAKIRVIFNLILVLNI